MIFLNTNIFLYNYTKVENKFIYGENIRHSVCKRPCFNEKCILNLMHGFKILIIELYLYKYLKLKYYF